AAGLAGAGAHVVLGLPLNLLLPKSSRPNISDDDGGKPHIPLDRPMLVLGFAFAASWTVVTAMALHLPRLLEAAGASTVQAVAAGGTDRSIAGWCPHPGSRFDEALPSDDVRPAFGNPASARCSHPWHIRRRRGLRRLHRAAWSWQRHSYDCARDGAAGHVRPRKLRVPVGAARCTVPCHDGRGAVTLRYSH